MSHILSTQKTPFLANEKITKNWLLVDAENQILGRIATEIAKRLMGKHLVEYSTHQDIGDCIVVINASKIRTTGKKVDQKIYYKHSLYPGGLKSSLLKDELLKDSPKVIELAVKRMLPKGPLGRKILKRLFVYPNTNHRQEAQNLKEYKIPSTN